ncbi:nucleotide-binding universal stress UspA family protein [Nakamurella sp. UYEF19]|uniref:universal stress protein n=1 Tax=Nakamurella sp. UYEF19 TaxID=1756392 RepID=UPI0033960E91
MSITGPRLKGSPDRNRTIDRITIAAGDGGTVKHEVPPLPPQAVPRIDLSLTGSSAIPRPMSASRNVIVVGIDGSEQSQQALRWARFLAEQLGCTLQAVTAWQLFGEAGWGGYGWSVVPGVFDPVKTAEQILAGAVNDVLGANHPDGLVLTANEGASAKVLLEVAKDARMLVVGSRGHGGFAGLLLGSVSSACAEHAECPVLVIHGDSGPSPD